MEKSTHDALIVVFQRLLLKTADAEHLPEKVDLLAGLERGETNFLRLVGEEIEFAGQRLELAEKAIAPAAIEAGDAGVDFGEIAAAAVLVPIMVG